MDRSFPTALAALAAVILLALMIAPEQTADMLGDVQDEAVALTQDDAS